MQRVGIVVVNSVRKLNVCFSAAGKKGVRDLTETVCWRKFSEWELEVPFLSQKLFKADSVGNVGVVGGKCFVMTRVVHQTPSYATSMHV